MSYQPPKIGMLNDHDLKNELRKAVHEIGDLEFELYEYRKADGKECDRVNDLISEKDKKLDILEFTIEAQKEHLKSKQRVIKDRILKVRSLKDELEANKKLIADSIPRGNVEAVRNNYMQFLSDCIKHDSDQETAQAVFDVLDELLTNKESE